MAKKHLTLDFAGMEDVMSQYEAMGGRLNIAAEHALAASHQIVTRKLKAAIAPHRETGATEESMTTDPYETMNVDGVHASVEVGFSVRAGGLASIFLMYGTPKIPPDMALYNAIYGAATLKEVSEKQAEVFYKRMTRQGAKK